MAQKIALVLNIDIDRNLGNFELKRETLASASPQGGCGSDTS
ncbi:hypothetical protein [Flavobacterium sp. ACAM 123]|nr:hypothetical protein [Flavobacterium sp. ACAM 123]